MKGLGVMEPNQCYCSTRRCYYHETGESYIYSAALLLLTFCFFIKQQSKLMCIDT